MVPTDICIFAVVDVGFGFMSNLLTVGQQIADDLQGKQLNWKPVGAQLRRSTSETGHCVNSSEMFHHISPAPSFAQNNCFASRIFIRCIAYLSKVTSHFGAPAHTFHG